MKATLRTNHVSIRDQWSASTPMPVMFLGDYGSLSVLLLHLSLSLYLPPPLSSISKSSVPSCPSLPSEESCPLPAVPSAAPSAAPRQPDAAEPHAQAPRPVDPTNMPKWLKLPGTSHNKICTTQSQHRQIKDAWKYTVSLQGYYFKAKQSNEAENDINDGVYLY